MSITYLKEAVPAAQVAKNLADVKETVTGVIADIRERGDEAVREYSAKFDHWSPESFRLSDSQIEDIVATLPPQVITDIEFVQEQVRSFAKHPIRHKLWKLVTPLNAQHMKFAWISLFGVAICDLYVRLVASGTISDPGFHF